MVLIGRILLFIQITAIAAVVGAFAAFFGLFFISTMLGADNMNGGLAMGAASFMPVGGVVGAALGAWFGWRLNRKLDGKAALAGGFGLLALAALAGGGWYALGQMAGGGPYEAGHEPTVLVEWRLPELLPEEEIKPVYRYTMRSTFMDWTLSSNWDIPAARQEDGHTILRFRGQIRWRRGGRIFQLWKFPNHDDRITVQLQLGADPKPAADYGPWHEVESAPGHAFRTQVLAE